MKFCRIRETRYYIIRESRECRDQRTRGHAFAREETISDLENRESVEASGEDGVGVVREGV